jgi:exodeoxyribonuclease V alpha subunit
MAGACCAPPPRAAPPSAYRRRPGWKQQYLLLQRNLVYTGIARGKKLVVVVGQRTGLAFAVRNNKIEQRFSGLLTRLKAV